MVNIGYIRVSSNKQTLEHQRFEINHFAQNEHLKIDMWVKEKRYKKIVVSDDFFDLRETMLLYFGGHDITAAFQGFVNKGDLFHNHGIIFEFFMRQF